MKFKNISEALEAIANDAAREAWSYLVREKAEAIQYLVDNNWTDKQLEDHFKEIYGPTEERVMHKIGLVIAALVAGAVLE